MRKICWLVTIAALTCTVGSRAQAVDKPGAPKEKAGHAHKVHLHTPDGEIELDPSKEADKKKLDKYFERIEKGDFEKVELAEKLAPMKLEADLGIWALVTFLGLVFFLRKFAWTPMLEGLQKREEVIRLSVDEAKLAREETERLRAQFKTEMDQAFAKIPLMMEEARRTGEKLVDEMRSKSSAEIQAERQRLRREIEVARDQALQELWTQAAQLATLISAKAIGRSLSSEDHSRLVDEALSEIKQTSHK